MSHVCGSSVSPTGTSLSDRLDNRDGIIDFEDPATVGRALGEGYRVEARILIWQEANALTVPAGCWFRQDDGWAVFAVDDKIARLQPVQLGQRNQSVGQILGGLAAEQTLVLHPTDPLTDGTRITVRES